MKLIIKAVPVSGRNDLAYFIGKPYVILDLDQTPESSDTCTFSLYNDQLSLMFYAKKGDKLAIRVFEFTGRLLGTKLADFIAFSAPEAIVLFGGLARAKEFLREPIQKAMDDNVLSLWKGKVKLVFSQLKESDAAILGASALAWEL